MIAAAICCHLFDLYDLFSRYFITFSMLQVSKGADVNMQNNVGSTPLHKAAVGNQIFVVKHLLEHGADPSVRNASGMLAEDLTDYGTIKEVGLVEPSFLLPICPAAHSVRCCKEMPPSRRQCTYQKSFIGKSLARKAPS
jgi:ankyrin repeat protein